MYANTCLKSLFGQFIASSFGSIRGQLRHGHDDREYGPKFNL